jgi:hypothetical protein
LAQVLLVYADPGNRSGPDDLRQAVAIGRYPWLEEEFSACLHDSVLTPLQWAALTGQADAPPSPQIMLKQQQKLWHTVFPTKPYPVGEL